MNYKIIKFRVWDKEKLKFDINEHTENIQFSLWDWSMSKCLIFPVDSYIFQQYTGLNDSKGNPIYEGDILKEYTNNGNNTAIGVCKQTLGGWKIFSHPDSSICYHGWKDEVIGNIFENPELLK